jgi:hypothetical protein
MHCLKIVSDDQTIWAYDAEPHATLGMILSHNGRGPSELLPART